MGLPADKGAVLADGIIEVERWGEGGQSEGLERGGAGEMELDLQEQLQGYLQQQLQHQHHQHQHHHHQQHQQQQVQQIQQQGQPGQPGQPGQQGQQGQPGPAGMGEQRISEHERQRAQEHPSMQERSSLEQRRRACSAERNDGPQCCDVQVIDASHSAAPAGCFQPPDPTWQAMNGCAPSKEASHGLGAHLCGNQHIAGPHERRDSGPGQQQQLLQHLPLPHGELHEVLQPHHQQQEHQHQQHQHHQQAQQEQGQLQQLLQIQQQQQEQQQSLQQGVYPQPQNQAWPPTRNTVTTMGEKRKTGQREGSGVEWLRILVVEDNAVNRMVVLGILRKMLGLKCDVAHNGREAVEACARKEYDFIFMVSQYGCRV